MYRTIKSLAAAAAIALVAACGDAGSPTESAFVAPDAPLNAAAKPGTTTGQLTFSYTQSQSEEQAQSAFGGLGRINFTGSLFSGTPCVNVTATHSVASNVVTLNVTSASNGQSCIQVVTFNNYQGNISGLAAGTYTFNVLHNGSPAYSNTVTVL